jgi:anti-sigma B factor antagonist
MPSISVKVLPNSVHVVELGGDFDLGNLADVEQVLEQLIRDDDCRVAAVDLSSVTFLDSTTLSALTAARDRAQLVYKPVWLVRPKPEFWRVFEITMLDRLFRAFDSLAELQAYGAETATRLRA